MTEANLTKLANAIATQEGFFTLEEKPNRPQRNNNPGDLRDACNGTEWIGQIGVDDGGFCIFATIEDGWRALQRDLTNHAAKWPWQSLASFIGGEHGWPGYAPASDSNEATGYAEAIADALGVTPQTRFSEL